MNSLAIIGAGGFVGTRLMETLVLEGAEDFCAIIRGYHSQARFSRLGPAVTIRMADATKVDELVRAFKDFHVVVNLVSGEADNMSRSTETIYQACLDAGVKRLIHMSSAVVYRMVEAMDINDDSPPVKGLWSPYAKAKARSEIFLRERLGRTPLQVCVLRPSLVWGPRSVWTLSVVRDLMNRAAYLVGEGGGTCNTIYVDNLVSCILTCCNYPGDVAGFFNVSDAETVTWMDFYNSFAPRFQYNMNQIFKVPEDKYRPTLQTRLGELKTSPFYMRLKERISQEKRALVKAWLKAKLVKKDRDMQFTDERPQSASVTREMWELQSTRRKLSNTKFQRHFGYQPSVSFAEGIARTIRWIDFIGMC